VVAFFVPAIMHIEDRAAETMIAAEDKVTYHSDAGLAVAAADG